VRSTRFVRAGRLAAAVLGGRCAVACAIVCAASLLSVAVPVASSAAERGIVDNRLETVAPINAAQIPAIALEMGRDRLGAKWTRILVHWDRLQPVKPGESYAEDVDADGYDDDYVNELRSVVVALTANGVNVIFAPTGTPRWASDDRLWVSGYSAAYPPKMDDPEVSRQFGALAAFLAGQFGSSARYSEVWNEPNTAGTFYPQTRPGDPNFAARTYLKMLKVFYAGAKEANPSAVVIAGATAPRGADDVRSTSPRTFATYLRDHGAEMYFDAYSHHPYPWAKPEQIPPKWKKTVWLGNLPVLLRLFPTKDFYLTEYGYATQAPTLIGFVVSRAVQALYLRQAYAFVTRQYPRVKALLWFMVQDLAPAADRLGAYMGLLTTDGTPKLGWYAFSGGNSLTLNAPPVVGASETIPMSGSLKSGALGALAGKKIRLERRGLHQASWATVASTRTDAWGAFAFGLRQPAGTKIYRTVWDGVRSSAWVRVTAR
jgi:hypothetical protein